MKQVYLPVAVTIEDDHITAAAIDFDGAPWMYVTEEDNVWNPETDGWETDEDTEDRAIELLAEGLAYAHWNRANEQETA